MANNFPLENTPAQKYYYRTRDCVKIGIFISDNIHLKWIIAKV